jgi:hypothetical protein
MSNGARDHDECSELEDIEELERAKIGEDPPGRDAASRSNLRPTYDDLLQLYAPLTDPLLKIPVYVGQSISDKVAVALTEGLEGPCPGPLSTRLKIHADSIEEVPGISIKYFACRLLLVQRINADWGEESLKNFYKPVWNSVLRGFGPKAHGVERVTGRRSPWATVHGDRVSRPVAQPNARTREEWIRLALRHIERQVAEGRARLDKARAALGA